MLVYSSFPTFCAYDDDDVSCVCVSGGRSERSGSSGGSTTGGQKDSAREEGERRERLKQGRQVATLLVETNLPFTRALGQKALEQDVQLRCFRGLLAKTLAPPASRSAQGAPLDLNRLHQRGKA